MQITLDVPEGFELPQEFRGGTPERVAELMQRAAAAPRARMRHVPSNVLRIALREAREAGAAEGRAQAADLHLRLEAANARARSTADPEVRSFAHNELRRALDGMVSVSSELLKDFARQEALSESVRKCVDESRVRLVLQHRRVLCARERLEGLHSEAMRMPIDRLLDHAVRLHEQTAKFTWSSVTNRERVLHALGRPAATSVVEREVRDRMDRTELFKEETESPVARQATRAESTRTKRGTITTSTSERPIAQTELDEPPQLTWGN